MTVYILRHVLFYNNNSRNIKFIGIFSSIGKAQDAIQHLMDEVSKKNILFKNNCETKFTLDEVIIDSSLWSDEFSFKQ